MKEFRAEAPLPSLLPARSMTKGGRRFLKIPGPWERRVWGQNFASLPGSVLFSAPKPWHRGRAAPLLPGEMQPDPGAVASPSGPRGSTSSARSRRKSPC